MALILAKKKKSIYTYKQRCSYKPPSRDPFEKVSRAKCFDGQRRCLYELAWKTDRRNWEKLRRQIRCLNPRWCRMVSGMLPARLRDWLSSWIQKHFRIVQWAAYTQRNVHKSWISGIIYNWTFHSPEPRLTQNQAWGSTRPMAHPPNLPSSLLVLRQYPSCLQEAAGSETPHRITHRHNSLLFYVFSGLLRQQQSPLEETKTIDKKKQNRITE